MILELVEVDRPRGLRGKLAEYLARPPQPILKFYGEFKEELSTKGRHILFTVRNGLILPLLYGIYVTVNYDSGVDYLSKTDHIGPFSTDGWRLTLDNTNPASIEMRVGLVPLEIKTDMVKMRVE